MTIFGFRENFSGKVAKNLAPDSYLLESNEQSIRDFVQTLINIQPVKILGLGKYTGRDKDKIRVETICINKFKNHFLGPEKEILEIHPFIELNADYKLSKGMGNSYCNLVAYLIQKAINDGKLHSQFTFLHIPNYLALMKKISIF